MMLSNTEVFQCYIRMNNAKSLFKTKIEIDQYIKSILVYIDKQWFKPFSTVKGESNYPQEYDCKCINKFRVEYNLEPYEYIAGVGIVKHPTVAPRLIISKERLSAISDRAIKRYLEAAEKLNTVR